MANNSNEGENGSETEERLDPSDCQELNRMAVSYLNEMRIKLVEDAFSPFGQKLLKPNRALIGQGTLTKICKKRPKKRGFFLFSDILVYGGITLNKPTKKFNGQQILSLYKLKVESLPDSGDMKHAFTIYTPKKSFTLLANSQKEKEDWIGHLRKCALYCNENIEEVSASTTGEIRSAAPVWISDSNATGCMVCSKKFTIVNRRHHCRNCGSVVCGDCSKNKYILPNISAKELQRVCEGCFGKLLINDRKLPQEQHEISSYNSSDSSGDDSESGGGGDGERLDMADSSFYAAGKDQHA
ncbi:hypothetical protein ACOME3_002100 [Neoechinorhynchus agilis]